jgi:methyltransferase (TIGR00027 family)
LDGVSETALGAAEMRAAESVRPDRLIDDPYAEAFVAAAPPLFADIPSLADEAELAALIVASVTGVAVRTRYFDDFLLSACATGCRQVVLLGAGLDTRAFRLDWPDGVRVFELDLPALFEFKERVLDEQGAVPACAREVIAVDFRDDWSTRLTAVGFDAASLSVWVAEGLLVYLSHEDSVRLLTTVGELSTNDSQLSFDYEAIDQSMPDQGRVMAGMEEVASMWHGGLNQRPEEWLREHHWEVESSDRLTLAAAFGRDLPDSATSGFLTATRKRLEEPFTDLRFRGTDSSEGRP